MAEIIRFKDIRRLLTGRKAEQLATRIIQQSKEIHLVTKELRRFAFKVVDPKQRSGRSK